MEGNQGTCEQVPVERVDCGNALTVAIKPRPSANYRRCIQAC